MPPPSRSRFVVVFETVALDLADAKRWADWVAGFETYVRPTRVIGVVPWHYSSISTDPTVVDELRRDV